MSALEFVTRGQRWRANLATYFDLAITLDFAGAQPAFFAELPASAKPLQVGGFTGSIATGASCNCAVYTLAPHCHGTHTECAAHVTAQGGMTLADVTPVAPCLALLVSVPPELLGHTRAAAAVKAEATDRCITREALIAAAAPWLGDAWTALIVRTLPNGVDKRSRSYKQGPCPAPYMLGDAMAWVVERNVISLIVDLPSLDRADDGGHLTAHRIYWGLPPGSVDAGQARRREALVTELAFVPDDADDGLYLLDLQVPAFATDAAPSRPVIYPVQPPPGPVHK